MPSPDPPPQRLRPTLGAWSAAAIVVGEVIGLGIFFMPRGIAKSTHGYVGLILALWILCGLVNLCGALTLAELSAMYPQAGGTYVILRETYGRMWAFLWAWAEFWVIRTGAIAALAVAGAAGLWELLAYTQFRPDAEQRSSFEKIVAVGLIAGLGTVNILGTRWGSGVQNVMTSLKVAVVALIGLLPLIALRSGRQPLEPAWPESIDYGLIGGIGLALGSIMFAYDGWGNVTVVAEEVCDPRRNVPRALVAGVVFLIVLYVGANLANHLTLSAAEIANNDLPIPAIMVCERLLPWVGVGGLIVTAMVMISPIGALNGNILVGPRVLFAVARDQQGLAALRRVSPRRQTPGRAIAAMCGWAILLIVLADLNRARDTRLFDLLIHYCIFGGTLFYLSAVLAVFVLRRKRPDAERPYRTWGYPYTPAVFVSFYVCLLASMLWSGPRECLLGLGLVALGLPFYFFWLRRFPAPEPPALETP